MVGNVEHGMMKSPPMDSTHGRQRRAWHAIIAFGRQTWSNDVGRGMPSLPLGSTDGWTVSDVACQHRIWPALTVKRRRAWQAIIAFGKHTGSNDVGRCMPSSPLGSTHGRTTSGVACHHRLWTAVTVGRRRAWYSIITLGQHTRSDGIGRGMPSSPLDNTHGRQCREWHDITSLGQHTRSLTSSVA